MAKYWTVVIASIITGLSLLIGIVEALWDDMYRLFGISGILGIILMPYLALFLVKDNLRLGKLSKWAVYISVFCTVIEICLLQGVYDAPEKKELINQVKISFFKINLALVLFAGARTSFRHIENDHLYQYHQEVDSDGQ